MYASERNRVYSYDFFFFSSRRRHTRFDCDWSSDVCSSDLTSRYTSVFPEPVTPWIRTGVSTGVARMPATTPRWSAVRLGGGGDDSPANGSRSEERRVGKEGRSRWAPDH